MRMMTINGYLLNLEIDLILEVFADAGQEVIECVVQWAWSFPPYLGTSGRFFTQLLFHNPYPGKTF